MTQQTTKLVADFGGTHLRIGFSDGFSVTGLSKVRYSSGVSSLKLISDYGNSFDCYEVQLSNLL